MALAARRRSPGTRPRRRVAVAGTLRARLRLYGPQNLRWPAQTPSSRIAGEIHEGRAASSACPVPQRCAGWSSRSTAVRILPARLNPGTAARLRALAEQGDLDIFASPLAPQPTSTLQRLADPIVLQLTFTTWGLLDRIDASGITKRQRHDLDTIDPAANQGTRQRRLTARPSSIARRRVGSDGTRRAPAAGRGAPPLARPSRRLRGA